MKPFYLVLAAFILPFFSGCEKELDELSQCDKEKWETQLNVGILIRTLSADTLFLDFESCYYLDVHYEIEKTYCNGTKSGLFTFSKHFSNEDLQNPVNGSISIWDGLQYVYKIQHDEDRITIKMEVEVHEFGKEPVFYPTTAILTGDFIKHRYAFEVISHSFENTNDMLSFGIDFIPQ